MGAKFDLFNELVRPHFWLSDDFFFLRPPRENGTRKYNALAKWPVHPDEQQKSLTRRHFA